MSIRDWFENLRARKAESFDEFVALLREEHCTEVVAEPFRDDPSGFGTPDTVIGTIGNFTYGSKYTGKSPNSRYVVLTESYGTRFGSQRGTADRNSREKFAIQVLITADARLQQLRDSFPHLTVSLQDAEGLVMDEATLQRLRADAQRYGVEPSLPS